MTKSHQITTKRPLCITYTYRLVGLWMPKVICNQKVFVSWCITQKRILLSEICFSCEQCPKSIGSRKYLFHEVALKRKFNTPKFIFLVNNAIIHLHPDSICFIMCSSKGNFIVNFFDLATLSDTHMSIFNMVQWLLHLLTCRPLRIDWFLHRPSN